MASFAATILQLALALLLSVQSNSSVSDVQRQQAISVATQAIQLATQALGTPANSSPSSSTTQTGTNNTTSNIVVLAPSGGETWQMGTQQTIRWSMPSWVGGVQIDLINTSGVSTPIDRVVPGTSYTWTIPSNIAPGQYFVKVWASSYQGQSSAPFTITSAPTQNNSSTVTTTSPSIYVSLDPATPVAGTLSAGANQAAIIMFRLTNTSNLPASVYAISTYFGGTIQPSDVKQVYWYANGSLLGQASPQSVLGQPGFMALTSSYPNTMISLAPNTSQSIVVKVDVSSSAVNGRTLTGSLVTKDYIDTESSHAIVSGMPVNGNQLTIASTVAAPMISMTSPNGGEKFLKGSQQGIQWTSSNVSQVNIQLYKSGNFYSNITSAGYPVNNGNYYAWTIPSSLPDGSDYQVRVSDANSGALAMSSQSFSILSQVSGSDVLVATLSPITPPSGQLTRGTLGATLAAYDVTNVNQQPASINSVTLVCQGCGGSTAYQPDFSNVYLIAMGNATPIASLQPASSSPGFWTFNLPATLTISAQQKQTLVLKADLASVGSGFANQNIYIELRSLVATDANGLLIIQGTPVYSNTLTIK